MSAPAQDPTFDLFEAAQFHFQKDRTVRVFPDALGIVPSPFGHETGSERVESQADALRLSGRVDTEASTEDLGDGKISRAGQSAST